MNKNLILILQIYQKNVESSIIEETVSKEVNDSTINNTHEGESLDYIPSSNITTINETNLNVNDSLNFPINNDALPVNIRDVYVPVSKSTADYYSNNIFVHIAKNCRKNLLDIWN